MCVRYANFVHLLRETCNFYRVRVQNFLSTCLFHVTFSAYKKLYDFILFYYREPFKKTQYKISRE